MNKSNGKGQQVEMVTWISVSGSQYCLGQVGDQDEVEGRNAYRYFEQYVVGDIYIMRLFLGRGDAIGAIPAT